MRRAARHAVTLKSSTTRPRSACARDRAAAAYVVRRRDHSHSHGHVPEGDPDYEVTFRIRKTGETKTVPAYEGDNLLRLAQRHDIPLEGACEGVTACSTCHVVLTDDFFDQLEDDGDHADDREEDTVSYTHLTLPTTSCV